MLKYPRNDEGFKNNNGEWSAILGFSIKYFLSSSNVKTVGFLTYEFDGKIY